MKRFRILISRISDGTQGGAEMSAFDQAMVLHSLGHDVTYVSNLPKLTGKARERDVRTASLPWIQIGQPPLRYVLFWLLLPWFTAKALWLVYRHKPDIINAHSREDQIVYTLAKPLHGRPVVWKDAGDLRHTLRAARTNPVAAVYENLLRRAIRKADFIYMLSEADVSNLAAIMGDDVGAKLTNIPSSILYDNYDLDAETQPRSEGKVIVGYIGYISELKGMSHLAEAAKAIADDNVEYWICGEGGEYKDQLERETKDLGFKLLGYADDTSSFLNTFDIFVQPSLNEGWGRTVKEAMYFGLPVVGSNSGGVAQQIDHEKTGLLFEPGNAESLAEQLKRVIDDEALRAKLGEAAKAKAVSDGDFRTIVEKQILPIYERLIQ